MGSNETVLADGGSMQTYKTLVQDTLNEQIYQQIKEKLIIGEFRPGDRLVLRNLAAALGTSVVPVRDALQKLESLGALRLERTFVVPRLTIAELTEIRDIRVALEGLSAARAARAATPESLAGLRIHFDAMVEAAHTNDTSRFLRANARFHLHIADMSNSPILRDMIEPLWLRMGPSVRLAKAEPGKLTDAIPDHETAFAAIATNDAATARKAVVSDVVNCFGILADSFQEAGE
ncbi:MULTISPECIES: GntR family transcriptional regulator [unclassified Shinella]|jgi:GntR family colanic acid and biofilm gene transcriptional regulator|uniref:GntR family transcriptional regulator n=1 Tax=unclassified Shinella TaxID=2643062 RepID=UPI0003C539B3|nr:MULTISPECIES: GntR family transcriptional regulator [unclassified Shinella]EYR78351.1 HTH-type transcriptional regulator McbR [Shinella sp. DD12]MCO5151673.1 GntR family transcriptional regulator [Shinella sp.]MDC7266320.1 GntR family transcriptional regulator [Shinella sp. HY16]MDC7273217.1 GntR family transcriptional regulator [Shinella sp. YZ44]